MAASEAETSSLPPSEGSKSSENSEHGTEEISGYPPIPPDHNPNKEDSQELQSLKPSLKPASALTNGVDKTNAANPLPTSTSSQHSQSPAVEGSNEEPVKSSPVRDLTEATEENGLSNTYQLDVTHANIYKYAIKFHCEKALHPREEKMLTQLFYEYADLKKNDRSIVLCEKRHVIVSSQTKALEIGAIQVPLSRSETSSRGSITCMPRKSQGSAIFFTTFGQTFEAEKQDFVGKERPSGTGNPTAFRGLAIATVYATEVQLVPHWSTGPLTESDGYTVNVSPSQTPQYLSALDSILQRDATVHSVDSAGHTKLVLRGKKLFDYGVPSPHTCKGLELRLGLEAETHLGENGIVLRSTQAANGIFMQAVNLEVFLCEHFNCTSPDFRWDRLKICKIVKGKRITKTYGDGAEFTISDIHLENPDKATVPSREGLSSVSEYMQSVHGIVGANRYNIPCIDIGTSQRSILLPAKTCLLLPGQVFSGDAGKIFKDAGLSKAVEKTLERHRESIIQPQQGDPAFRLLPFIMSPQTCAAFEINICQRDESRRPLRAAKKVVEQELELYKFSRPKFLKWVGINEFFPFLVVVDIRMLPLKGPEQSLIEATIKKSLDAKRHAQHASADFSCVFAHASPKQGPHEFEAVIRNKVAGKTDNCAFLCHIDHKGAITSEEKGKLDEKYEQVKHYLFKHGNIFKAVRNDNVNTTMAVKDSRDMAKRISYALSILDTKRQSISSTDRLHHEMPNVIHPPMALPLLAPKTFSLAVHVIQISRQETDTDVPASSNSDCRRHLVAMVGTWSESGRPICRTNFSLQECISTEHDTHVAGFDGVFTPSTHHTRLADVMERMTGNKEVFRCQRIQVYRTGLLPVCKESTLRVRAVEKEVEVFRSLSSELGCEFVYVTVETQPSFRLYTEQEGSPESLRTSDTTKDHAQPTSVNAKEWEQSVMTKSIIVRPDEKSWFMQRYGADPNTKPLKFTYQAGIETGPEPDGHLESELKHVRERSFADSWNYPVGIFSKWPAVCHLAQEGAKFMIPMLKHDDESSWTNGFPHVNPKVEGSLFFL